VRRLAVLGARIVDGSHVASEYGREECHSFVPGPKHGKDNDEKLYHTGGEDGGTRQALSTGKSCLSSSREIVTHERLFGSAPMPPLAQLGAEGKMRVAFIIPHR
jgi:hypothetical protein